MEQRKHTRHRQWGREGVRGGVKKDRSKKSQWFPKAQPRHELDSSYICTWLLKSNGIRLGQKYAVRAPRPPSPPLRHAAFAFACSFVPSRQPFLVDGASNRPRAWMVLHLCDGAGVGVGVAGGADGGAERGRFVGVGGCGCLPFAPVPSCQFRGGVR